MKSFVRACAAVALLALLAACSDLPPVFQDVGTDPHPPNVRLLGIGYQPAAVEGGVTPPPDFQPVVGFVVYPNDGTRSTVAFSVQYTDPGGDVQRFKVRDRDGTLNTELLPTAPLVDIDGDGILETLQVPDFFAGTIGQATLENVPFTARMEGEHRIELWAEDSHGSRSPKIEFVITVVL
jgi:hypothetical protein